MAKKCEQYAKYFKKLKRYVASERHQVEGGGELEQKREGRAHGLAQMRGVLLYQEMEGEKLADRDGELQERVAEGIERERDVD